jgi:tetratricopeptide (TPR) repeat protein
MSEIIGTLLNERYRLDAELGRGGMGVVYRAHDMLLERAVSVKVLNDARLAAESRAHLLHEAQAAARLDHPNIVTVHDAGESSSVPFIVMQLVDGASLHERPPRDIDEIISIAKQLCAALDHAHGHSIVHRDLKPENVLVTSDGSVKLMDFGLARSVASRLTSGGAIVGTVFYLAPELALGQDFDGRADLYALGVMLYELTTGRLPFSADDPVAVISQHLHAPVVPPRARNDRIPPALDALIVGLMSKRPEDRPASAGEVLQALEELDYAAPDIAVTGEFSVLDRIVRGRLVGRHRELAEATAFWQRAVSGEGQVLLISGEPGVGKTRLARELTTRVEVSGGRVLLGECYAEGGAPFAPVAQIIQTALDQSDSHFTSQRFAGARHKLTGLDSHVLADLITLVPSLRARYPDVPPNPQLDPESEQRRLFESVVEFCSLLTDEGPLLLILDDAHWADSGTLFLVRHMARRMRRRSLMILITYREVELDEARPIHQVLLDLNRERLAVRLKLSRLTRDETHDLLASMFAEEITPEFLDGIYRETEGNPFFIEEVCKALIEGGKLYFEHGRWQRPNVDEMEIPQSVRIAIQSRVGKLDEVTQATLQLAAVFGREFDYDTLDLASDLDEDALIGALESAERAQLIQEVGAARDVTFAFAHALIPTTLYESVSTLRRRRLHRRAAEAIEMLRPDDFEALAFHCAAAGERAKAIRYNHHAARRAEAVFAHDVARQHLITALDLIDAGEQEETRLILLEELADVHHRLGERSEAIAAYGEALDVWHALAGVEKMDAVRLHRKIVRTVVDTALFADRQRFEASAQTSLEAGLELTQGEQAHAETVRLLTTLSRNAWLPKAQPDWDAAEQHAQAAVAMAEQLDEPEELSAALGALAIVYGARGLFRERVAVSLRRLELSADPRFSDVNERTNILLETGKAMVHVGEYRQAIPYFREAESLSSQIQAVNHQVAALRYQAQCWFRLDCWDSVLGVDETRRALENRYTNFLERSGPICFHIALIASVHALRGHAGQAISLRDESKAIMTAGDGPPEMWGRNNHF